MAVSRLTLPALLLAASLLYLCDAKPFQCIFTVNGGVLISIVQAPAQPLVIAQLP